MASHPDAHPDSAPSNTSDDIEQVSPSESEGRESIEDTPGTGNSTSGAQEG